MSTVLAMRDRNMFIGTGQCGGNIAREFDKLGYQAYYINSNLADLRTLGVSSDKTFHIPSAEGCNKDVQKAKEYAKLYYDQIIEILNTKYSQFKNKFFCFSLGGGTGGGISPVLIQAIATANPDANVGAIVALPDESDSVKAKENALRCLQSLSSLLDIGTLKNVYLLDNSAGDILEINADIAERLTRLFNVTKPNIRGIVDTSEIENLLSISGCVNIFDIIEGESNLTLSQDKFLTKSGEGCQKILYSLKDDAHLIQSELEEITGKPIDYFKGYCEDSENSIAFSFGMQMPKAKLATFERNYKEELESSRTEGKFGLNFDLGSPQPIEEVKEEKPDNASVLASLFN